MTPKTFLPLAAIAAPFFSTPVAKAAISYAIPGTAISENFDSLANTGTDVAWADNTTLPGWYASYGGSAIAGYNTSNGTATSNAGKLLSLGSTDDPDRAFGSQSPDSGATPHRIAAQLVNSSTVTLSQFTLTYTGEIWRAITSEAADGFSFEYRIGTGSVWTPVSALDFTSPYVASGSSTNRDGNAVGNHTIVSSTVSGLNWGVGEELWLRWTDKATADGAFQAQIGIDNLSFTAIPEPSSAWLGLAGAFAFVMKRRR